MYQTMQSILFKKCFVHSEILQSYIIIQKKGVTESFPNQLQMLFSFSSLSSECNCQLHISSVKTNLRNTSEVGFFLLPLWTHSVVPQDWLFTSRRGCSRKATSKDRPAGLLVGRPESRTGSDQGCPVRWRTGRAPNLLGSWWAFQSALGRGRLKRAEWRLGWGRPRWTPTEACVEKKETVKF